MRRTTSAVAALLLLAAVGSHCEQFKQFGPWRVHYMAFNASLLAPEVAERYNLVRGRNKGLVNVSAVGASGRGEKIAVKGRFLNLLGQARRLDFREIDDNGTVYYLAAFDFDDAETLRFEVTLDLPEQGVQTLRFQQALYFD